MSSATSTDAPVTAAPGRSDDGFRPWHFFVLVSLLAATTAVILSRRTSPENLIVISATIGAAGLAAAAFHRMLAPLAEGGVWSTHSTVSERNRATLEREKLLALRAIKELEFDHAMGKVSQQDFDEMAGRLRRRAASFLVQLDAQLDAQIDYRAIIERELSARLAVATAPAVDPPPTTDTASADSAARVATVRCECGTANDVDAAFCKRCGSRLAAAR